MVTHDVLLANLSEEKRKEEAGSQAFVLAGMMVMKISENVVTLEP